LFILDRYFPHEQSSACYAPFDRASEDGFTPEASSDSALNSYAQLATKRLGVERAIISLFDSTHQHLLAEATPSLSLIGGRMANKNERLILGSCTFPKERGICHCVESTPRRSSERQSGDTGDHDGVFIALDVKKDERFNLSNLQAGLSEIRSFVAVSIISPWGYNIGALTVMDSKAKSSESDQHSRQFLKDMAATVMEHLSMR
jgi:GAF domain-containing protein